MIKDILDQAFECAADLSESVDNTGLRPDLELIAKKCGIKEVIITDLGSKDACLLPFPTGGVIKINSLISEQRQRFSLAHEIAHALLDMHGYYALTPEKRASKIYNKTRNRPGDLEERICDKIAALLLMPEKRFRSELRRLGISMQSLVELAKSFGSSVQATAIRLTEVTDEACAVLAWSKEEHKSGAETIVPTWSAASTAFRLEHAVSLPRVVAGKSSAVAVAFSSSKLVSGIRYVNLGSIRGKHYVEVKGFGPEARRYVLSLILPCNFTKTLM